MAKVIVGSIEYVIEDLKESVTYLEQTIHIMGDDTPNILLSILTHLRQDIANLTEISKRDNT